MTTPNVPAPSKDASPLHTLGWAVFLGTSWTWCIGMFLPVLLVRDYGVWGWVVFAVPNVVGAAAMGWVLARPSASERVALAHRGAGVGFSVVTIGFHLYWVYWVVQGLVGAAAVVAVPALAAAFYVAGGLRKRLDLALAAGVWVASVVLFGVYGAADHGSDSFGAGQLPASHLLPLGLACVLGFALCPYLDLTFHRARRATAPRAGIAAFGIGFGGAFLLMIVFTLVYAPALVPGRWGIAHARAGDVLAAHMVLQAALTIALHAREVARRWHVPDPHVRAGGLAGAAASFVPILAGSLAPAAATATPTSELIYRLFMAFYALVFPAYVWMFVVPRPGMRTEEPTRRGLLAFAAVVAVAAPFFWLAFVNGRMHWLFAGVAVVLAGRWCRPRQAAPALAGA